MVIPLKEYNHLDRDYTTCILRIRRKRKRRSSTWIKIWWSPNLNNQLNGNFGRRFWRNLFTSAHLRWWLIVVRLSTKSSTPRRMRPNIKTIRARSNCVDVSLRKNANQHTQSGLCENIGLSLKPLPSLDLTSMQFRHRYVMWSPLKIAINTLSFVFSWSRPQHQNLKAPE